MSLAKMIIFEPVGYVTTTADTDALRKKNAVSKITIRQDLIEGLDGIQRYSHLFVLFHLSEVSSEDRKILRVHPRGRRDLRLVGVFATRTMVRPNPIALTIVELLSVEGNILTVKGLDAFDGSPVIDIKPYDPWDKVENPRVPDWWKN
jgi:tRNA (adenine37-N6)-methyltransferase